MPLLKVTHVLIDLSNHWLSSGWSHFWRSYLGPISVGALDKTHFAYFLALLGKQIFLLLLIPIWVYNEIRETLWKFLRIHNLFICKTHGGLCDATKRRPSLLMTRISALSTVHTHCKDVEFVNTWYQTTFLSLLLSIGPFIAEICGMPDIFKSSLREFKFSTFPLIVSRLFWWFWAGFSPVFKRSLLEWLLCGQFKLVFILSRLLQSSLRSYFV